MNWKFKVLAACMAASSILACDSESDIPLGGTCTIENDQRGAFMAPLTRFPVKLVADYSFSPNELNDISAAVAQWNSTGWKIANHIFFQLKQSTIPSSTRNGNPRDCSEDRTTDAVIYIVRETSTERWKALGFGNSVSAGSVVMKPGATIRCASGAWLEQQVIFINPSLIHSSQFMSIILHELGHSLGLDHSCTDDKDKIGSTFKSCATISPDHPYRVAVMYPMLMQAMGNSPAETKESLRRNDVERAQCLYSPK